MNLIEELDAKSWASTRRGKRREDHCCYRAAREIERLRAIADAAAVERERCAKIAEGFARANINLNPNQDEATVASSVAQAIANQIRIAV